MYHATQLHCCSKCWASRDPSMPELAYDDLRPQAGWRPTCMNTREYLAIARPLNAVTPFADIQGWAHELDLEDDLHNIFQGFGADWVGSAIVALAEDGFYGNGTLEARLARAHESASVFSKGKCFMPDFTLAHLGLGDNQQAWPEMAGKAALIKHLVFFVEEECRLYHIANYESPTAGDLLWAAWGLAEYVRITDQCGEVMSEDMASAAATAWRKFTSAYGSLAVQAAHGEVNRFKVRPKLHMHDHQVMFMECTLLNPRWWSCWMDEDDHV